MDDKFKLKADDITESITIAAKGMVSPKMHESVTSDVQAIEYLALVSDMISNLRDLRRKPLLEENVAIQFAYHLLVKGHIMPHSYEWLGLPGTRKYTQTYRKCTCINYDSCVQVARVHEPLRWVGRVSMGQTSFLTYPGNPGSQG